MYCETEVLPKFFKWVHEIKEVVPMDEARKYGQFFIANHIDAEKVGTRGALYDYFEKVKHYADMQKLINHGKLSAEDALIAENTCVLSRGIIWATQHDGFDDVKYDPISEWGMDIERMYGKVSPHTSDDVVPGT